MSALLRFAENNPFLLLLLVPVVIWIYWHRISLGALRLSQQRTQRLYRLMTTGAWKTASPLALQLAASDAFKRQIDDRAIRLAFTRHQPLRLLSDYRRADGVAVVSADGSCFEDGTRAHIASRLGTYWVLIFVGLSPWMIGTICAQLQWLSPPATVTVVLTGLVLTPMTLRIAFAVESAQWLINDLDRRYPPIQDDKAKKMDNFVEVPVISPRKPRSANAKREANHHVG